MSARARYQTVGVAGAGAFGTALALAAARAGRHVVLWARDEETVAIRELGRAVAAEDHG